MKLHEIAVKTCRYLVDLYRGGADRYPFTRDCPSTLPRYRFKHRYRDDLLLGRGCGRRGRERDAPLEDVLNSTEKLKEIYSTSKDGVSMIILEFDFGTDMNAVMNDVRDKVGS